MMVYNATIYYHCFYSPYFCLSYRVLYDYADTLLLQQQAFVGLELGTRKFGLHVIVVLNTS